MSNTELGAALLIGALRELAGAIARPDFDTLILGSGHRGKLLGRYREKIAVHGRCVGHSCPAVASLPSKDEAWSPRVAGLLHEAAQFGTPSDPAVTEMREVRLLVTAGLVASAAAESCR